jgi:hypothetical protein
LNLILKFSLFFLYTLTVYSYEIEYNESDKRIKSFVESTVKPALEKSISKLKLELGEMPHFKCSIFSNDHEYTNSTGFSVPFDTFVGVAFNKNEIGIILKENVAERFNDSTHAFYSKVLLHELFHMFFLHHNINFVNNCISEGLAVSYANQWFSIHKLKDTRFLVENVNFYEIFKSDSAGYDFRRLLVDYLLTNKLSELNSKTPIVNNREFLEFYSKHLNLARNGEYPNYHHKLITYLKQLIQNND